MATDRGYIEYVLEQIADVRDVSVKKMFGEYCIYVGGKPVAFACDNTVFVKILPQTTAILGEDNETGYPYDGAKLNYVLDIDNRDLSVEVLTMLYNILPAPKRK